MVWPPDVRATLQVALTIYVKNPWYCQDCRAESPTVSKAIVCSISAASLAAATAGNLNPANPLQSSVKNRPHTPGTQTVYPSNSPDHPRLRTPLPSAGDSQPAIFPAHPFTVVLPLACRHCERFLCLIPDTQLQVQPRSQSAAAAPVLQQHPTTWGAL